MATDLSSQFVEYLRRNKRLTAVDGRDDKAGQGGSDLRQAKLWELADLSAGEFADEAARFHGLARVTLQDMMSATPLVASFSQRFLRETVVFPFRSTDDRVVLAVADPTDQAAQRAAQIVLGAGVAIKVATAEDLAVVLGKRLDQDEADRPTGPTAQPREDDIESLRDLASGAPVVRAVNDLLERAVEMRASDIHIEPFQTGLVVRFRIDGLFRRGAFRRAAAGGDFPHQDHRQPQHRRAPPATGRCGAAEGRALRHRHPRGDHADAAR